jgi:hypothetical protein
MYPKNNPPVKAYKNCDIFVCISEKRRAVNITAKDFPKGISFSRITLRNSISSTMAGTIADDINSRIIPKKFRGILGE